MTLIDQLKTIPDPRCRRGQRHSLWLILFVSLLGSLCGYWGYRPLAAFSRKHYTEICQLLNLPPTTKVPSYSTFRRVFQTLDAQVWVDVFNGWALRHAPELAGRLLSIDGKSIKCTSRGGNSAAQDFVSLVSVYGHQDEGVVQLQLMHNKAKSEIEVAKQLVQQLPSSEFSSCLTLDALHAQTDTVKTLRDLDQDYVIGLKANQPTLYRRAQDLHCWATPLSVATHHELSSWSSSPTHGLGLCCARRSQIQVARTIDLDLGRASRDACSTVLSSDALLPQQLLLYGCRLFTVDSRALAD